MGRMSGIKWERSTRCAPVHNIISSDFPKYNPQPWKFMVVRTVKKHRKESSGLVKSSRIDHVFPLEYSNDAGSLDGKSRIEWLLSYEYQRMWIDEREQWKKRMYPENTTVNVDIVKRYVLTFKNDHQPPKPEKKKPFKMKKFQVVGSKTVNKRPPDDKAMKFEKKETETKTKDQ